MKKLILLVCLVSTTLNAQTVPKFSELELRIKAVDNFVAQELPLIKTSVDQALKEIEKFKDPKIVALDEKQKTIYQEKIRAAQVDMHAAENSLSVAHCKNLMIELDKMIKEKELYTQAKKTLQTMENDRNNSVKLKKYYSLTKAQKYNLAKVNYLLLNPADKQKAQEYEKNYNYTVREANRQEYVQSEIKNYKDKVIASLAYPENAIAKIKAADDQEKTAMEQFAVFKKTVEESLQFDYQLPGTWSMGLFSCEASKKPKYLRFKNSPNLVVLDNEGNYNAVIRLESAEPKKFSMVYHCSKMGSFGVCLENKAKKLCRLDNDCADSLTQMESTFDRNSFFLKFQNALPVHLLQSKKNEMLDPKKFNLISELAKMGRLGFYTSANELYNLFDPILEKVKTLQANTPEDFYKKIKPEIALFEKVEKARLQKLPGYSASSDRGTYSLQALSYMIATINGELEKIKEGDTIQEYSYKTCSQNSPDLQDFCLSYKSFLAKAKSFEAVEEIQNIVPEECPRVVFRFQQ